MLYSILQFGLRKNASIIIIYYYVVKKTKAPNVYNVYKGEKIKTGSRANGIIAVIRSVVALLQ